MAPKKPFRPTVATATCHAYLKRQYLQPRQAAHPLQLQVAAAAHVQMPQRRQGRQEAGQHQQHGVPAELQFAQAGQGCPLLQTIPMLTYALHGRALAELLHTVSPDHQNVDIADQIGHFMSRLELARQDFAGFSHLRDDIQPH